MFVAFSALSLSLPPPPHTRPSTRSGSPVRAGGQGGPSRYGSAASGGAGRAKGADLGPSGGTSGADLGPVFVQVEILKPRDVFVRKKCCC